ncbi:MAG: hypothetical protein IJ424_07700 [Oscillospiraceae bacterium]|nr:hypothetical protein [Oscillospiraceae bacterium]
MSKMPYRIMILITNPKPCEKASKMLLEDDVPMHFLFHGMGTASSEMMDILGLGSAEKGVLIGIMPKPYADKTLTRLRRELKIGAINSGIAFTLPMTSASNLVLKMNEPIAEAENYEGKDEHTVADYKFVMIAATVDQGYSEQVMNCARAVGAGGGTVLRGRSVASENAMKTFGLSVQEEKDIVLIVAKPDKKLEIMQAISRECGMHSEAKGTVISFPIDEVIGIE